MSSRPAARSGRVRTLARPAAFLSLLAAGVYATTAVAERMVEPSVTAQETTRIVSQMIPRLHLNRPVLDDAYSSKLLDAYLEALDPAKRYFTRDDIAQFRQYQTVLDDNLKSGNPSFALQVFERWKERVRERTEYAEKLIGQEYDFTRDETLVTDFDSLDWGTQTELDERWRKFIKEQLLQAKLDEDESVDTARERLTKKYRNEARLALQEDESDALEYFLTSAGQIFDPHSTYMSPKTLKEFQDSMRLSLEGIGAKLSPEKGYTKVVEIVDGGAAADDGRLQEGDYIIGVGDDRDAIEDIVEVRLNHVVRLIRGPKGTRVWLRVRPAEGGTPKVIDLVRKTIPMEDAAVRGQIIDLQERIGRPGRIGVVSIPSFYRDFTGANSGQADFSSSGRDVARVLEQFRRQGPLDAVIVDVRDNGGGALVEAIDITGMFIDQGPVVQVRDFQGSVESHEDTETGALTNLPLVVATNRFSASASEIFAGAIKDYKRGIVVGDTTTHGKGTVQNVLPVQRGLFNFGSADRGALKLTIQQFYRVNGDSTQNRGVPSDIKLPSFLDVIDSGEEFLDNALPFDQIRPAAFRATRMVSSGLIAKLAAMSRQRVAQSEDFGKEQRRIDRYLEMKDRKSVSLNEQVRQAERDKYAKEREEEKKEAEERQKNRDPKDIFPDSHHNDELLNIAADYVQELRRASTTANVR